VTFERRNKATVPPTYSTTQHLLLT